MAGARWKVGSGNQVKVIGHPWLQDDSNAFITSNLQGLEYATVDSLLSPDGQGWDRDLIADLFNQRDQRCILNTQVGGEGENDLMYWNEESSGVYTVKSAYRLIQRSKGAWCSTDNSSIWRMVWRIKAPPKVLNMVWRALSGCLPTKTALSAKRVPVTVSCPVCNGQEESIFHALVNCPFAAQCWRSRGGFYQGTGEMGFNSWLHQMLISRNKEEHGEIVTLCWSIWQARNNALWNQKKSEVNFVVFSTRQYLAEWKHAQAISTKALYQDVENGDGAKSWVKPEKDKVKISVDAAIFSENSKYGIGLLARDDKGEVVQGRACLFDGAVRPEYAEAIAVKEALSWVKRNEWRQIVLETDCLAVVQAIRSKISMNSPFGSVIMECRAMLLELNIELLFVRRSANMAAHFIARESCSFPDRVFDRGLSLLS